MFGNRLFLVPAALPPLMMGEPALVDAVLFGEDSEECSHGHQLALWPEASLNLADIECLDVDRTWHLLHFLLTGSADDAEHPLSFLAAGGRAVSDDLGNGPLRAFTPEDVWRLAVAPFIYPGTWYQLAVLIPLGLYGWRLELRHGPLMVLVLFLA